ncbi:unnamed protein product [Protopolystoma xenopodis]|uniref:Uncharacterized protein n=1 Tax=Protopolystoma xenopodis TaxID=117903 RepID=A0A3S5C4F2_9PLAT|nr:unnamed protein product [Protopolystoma xenopodis]
MASRLLSSDNSGEAPLTLPPHLDFSLAEIRTQLIALGLSSGDSDANEDVKFSNTSDSHLVRLKSQLDELIRSEHLAALNDGAVSSKCGSIKGIPISSPAHYLQTKSVNIHGTTSGTQDIRIRSETTGKALSGYSDDLVELENLDCGIGLAQSDTVVPKSLCDNATCRQSSSEDFTVSVGPFNDFCHTAPAKIH